jgi:quinol monooxygenase YgiN
MSLPANLVTIHPYFQLHPGKETRAQEVMEKFVSKTKGEPLCLFYEFSVLDGEVFCREGYVGAAGVLHHLENIGEVLEEMLTISDLTRLEFHGPAQEMDLLREPLAHLDARLFVVTTGVAR